MINSTIKYYTKFLPYFIPLACLYFTFVEYRFFGLFVIVYFFIKDILKIDFEISKKFTNFYLIFPIVFYFSRFIYATNTKFDNMLTNISQSNYFEESRFLDLQHFFLELYCNKNDRIFAYNYKFDKLLSHSCPYSNYWGPLSKLITIDTQNIWYLTLITSFIILILISIIYIENFKSFSKNRDLLFFLALSPPLNFLIDRMNFDLFIYIICYWIFKSNNLIYLKLLILVPLSLYKIHPIFLLFGYFLYFLLMRDLKKILYTFTCSIFTLVLIFNYYINNEFNTARPSEVKWSFGLLSDVITLNKIFNVNIIFLYVILTLVVGYFTLKFKNNFDYSLDDLNIFVISVWFILVSLYANYDYRIPLLFIIFFKLYDLNIKLLNYSLVIFIFLSPPPAFSNNFEYSNIVQNNVYYFDASFYFLVSYLILFIKKTAVNKFLQV